MLWTAFKAPHAGTGNAINDSLSESTGLRAIGDIRKPAMTFFLVLRLRLAHRRDETPTTKKRSTATLLKSPEGVELPGKIKLTGHGFCAAHGSRR